MLIAIEKYFLFLLLFFNVFIFVLFDTHVKYYYCVLLMLLLYNFVVVVVFLIRVYYLCIIIGICKEEKCLNLKNIYMLCYILCFIYYTVMKEHLLCKTRLLVFVNIFVLYIYKLFFFSFSFSRIGVIEILID